MTSKRPRLRPLAACMVLAGLCGAAQADEPQASDETLPTVNVVAATPLPGAQQDKSAIAAPVQVVTAEDLDRSHAIDLSSFMSRDMAGVYANGITTNPLQPDLNYRGYTASPLLGTAQGMSIFLDGMRMNQPFGDVVSWDLIPSAAISTMALMPGSNPLFGLNTLGGALSITTKDGYNDPDSEIQAYYGSHGRRDVQFDSGGSSGTGFDWYVTGHQFREDGWRDDSPSDVKQFFGKLGWQNGTTRLALSGAWAETDLNGNGLQEQRFLARDYDSVYTKPDNTQNRSAFLNLTAMHKFGDSVTFNGNAYFRDIKTTTFNGDINDESLGESLYQPNASEQAALAEAGYTGFPTSGENAANTPFPYWRCIANALLNEEPNEKCNGLIGRSRTSQQNDGLSGQFTFADDLAGHANQFTLGAAYDASRMHFHQSSQFGYLTPDRGVIPVDAYADGTQDSENAWDARVDLKGRSHTESVYATDTFSLDDHWKLTLSGRYDRTSVRNRDQLDPGGGTGSLDGNHRFSRFNPAVGLVWSASPELVAYLGYNEGSRAPSSIELGCADPDSPCKLPNTMAGDPPLKQVVAKTLEAGLHGTLGRATNWHVSAFRAVNEDDILFVADDVSGYGYFRNFGKTRRQGVELGFDSRLERLRYGANFTWLDATYRTAETVGGAGNSTNDEGPGFEGDIDIEPGDRIPLIPRKIFKAFAEFELTPQWSLTTDMIAIGRSYARGNENNRHEPDGVYYLGRGYSPGYAVVNLGVDFRPTPAWKLFAQVDNVFDREYYTAAQLGATGFDDAGNFVARPFSGPVVDGERPVLGATFYAPGAPRTFWVGVRYTFGGNVSRPN